MSGLICYCFGYSYEDLEEDFRQNGRSTILEKIIGQKGWGLRLYPQESPGAVMFSRPPAGAGGDRG